MVAATVGGRSVAPEPNGASELGALLLRARAGDRQALDQIVERLTPLLWNVARAQGLDVDTASDVVQAAWLALVEDLYQVHNPLALAAWLVKVTRREAWRARTALRRDQHIDPDDLTELPDSAGDIGAGIADDEQYGCLWRNLQLLDPRCQKLLRIVAFVDRPSYDAAAEALEMPRGSIGPTRGRCLAKLKTLLDDDPQWSAP